MIKVLIVEDDPMVRQINERFLEKIDGFSLVKSLSSINEATQFIEKEKVDLILLDLFFPNENGQDLLKWLRKHNYKIDVIMITADRSVETVEEMFRYGTVDYLIKPFTFERFTEALYRYRVRKEEFNNIINIKQEEVDKIFLFDGEDEVNNNEDVDEESFSKHTYDKVLKFLKKNSNSSYTAGEVASKLGVSRITARRYLELLEKEGIVVMDLEYGKVGRPKNKYIIKKTNM